MKNNYCIECEGKCDPRAIRCRQCSNRIVPPHRNKSHSLESRQKISKSLLGNIPWNKGKGKKKERLSKETLSKMSRERMLGDKNPAKRIEVRRKISESVLRMYKEHPEILENRKPSGENQYSGGYTSIEKKVAKVLSHLRIPFEHNYKIGRYFADFFIFENVVIECDGVYWHKDKSKDIRKDNYLKDKGYSIFRLSERRIEEDVFKYTKGVIEILRELGCREVEKFSVKDYPMFEE